MTEALKSTFEETVTEGAQRVQRSTLSLLSTGVVGGIDVSVGVLALMLVEHETNNPLFGALAFGIGFIALSLGNSELFTENFLVPLSARAARLVTWKGVIRLWAGTAATNLLGGWVMMGLILSGLTFLRPEALQLGEYFADRGIDWDSFAVALLAGSLITLMTWMEYATDSMPARLVAVVAIAFILAAGKMNHVVIQSIEMFGALQVGATFGYLDWAASAAWAALGNAVGGIALVTVLRLAQVTKEGVEDVRRDHAQSQ